MDMLIGCHDMLRLQRMATIKILWLANFTLAKPSHQGFIRHILWLFATFWQTSTWHLIWHFMWHIFCLILTIYLTLSDICPSTVSKIHHGREASTVIHITPFSAHLTQFSGTAAALPLSPSPAQINRLFLKPSYFRSYATPCVKPPNCRRTKRRELRDPSKGRDDIHNIDSARPEVSADLTLSHWVRKQFCILLVHPLFIQCHDSSSWCLQAKWLWLRAGRSCGANLQNRPHNIGRLRTEHVLQCADFSSCPLAGEAEGRSESQVGLLRWPREERVYSQDKMLIKRRNDAWREEVLRR